MPTFGPKSNGVLDSITPLLQTLMNKVVKHYDITLLEGHRAEEPQNELFSGGASKVKWPDSRHNTNPSMAVDVCPYPIPKEWGDLGWLTGKARDKAWKERVKFYQMVSVIQFCWEQMLVEEETAAHARKYQLRFGADWDGDGDYSDQAFDDLVHVELNLIT